MEKNKPNKLPNQSFQQGCACLRYTTFDNISRVAEIELNLKKLREELTNAYISWERKIVLEQSQTQLPDQPKQPSHQPTQPPDQPTQPPAHPTNPPPHPPQHPSLI